MTVDFKELAPSPIPAVTEVVEPDATVFISLRYCYPKEFQVFQTGLV